MATNTHTRVDERAPEHATARAVRALLASIAGTLVSFLPALVVLVAILLVVGKPGLAFVLFGMPVAAALGVALVFGVARGGAALASRL